MRQVALELFANQGYAATGIRQIASAAGLSLSAMYHHFSTKEELLLSIMRTTMTELEEEAARCVLANPDPADALGALVTSHVRMHAEQPQACFVTDTEVRSLFGDARAAIIAQRDSYQAVWVAVVEEGTASGQFHVANPKIAVLGLLEMCTGPARWYRADGPSSIEDICTQFTDMSLRLLGAPLNTTHRKEHA